MFAIHWIAARSKKVIVAIGSANKAFEPQNPFTAKERKKMIEKQLKASWIKNCKIVEVTDIDNDNMWVEHVDRCVPKYDVIYSNNSLIRKLMKRARKKICRIHFFKKEKYNSTNIMQRMKKVFRRKTECLKK